MDICNCSFASVLKLTQKYTSCKIKLFYSRRDWRKRVKRIFFCSDKNLFPLQVSFSQNSPTHPLRVPFPHGREVLSVFVAHLASLFILLSSRSIFLLFHSPLFHSSLLCNPTHYIPFYSPFILSKLSLLSCHPFVCSPLYV